MARTLARAKDKVFDHIKRSGVSGATCWETECKLRMRHQTASARIRELVIDGRLAPSGRVRPTGSGRNATVWIAR